MFKSDLNIDPRIKGYILIRNIKNLSDDTKFVGQIFVSANTKFVFRVNTP
jgi:hypothetical protein